MEQKLVEIKMPESGITVSIVAFLTYGQMKEIKRATAKDARQEVNAQGQQVVSFSADVNVRLDSLLINTFVKRIVAEDGTDLYNFEVGQTSKDKAEKILEDNLTEVDGMALEEAIASRVEFLKKKQS